MTVNLKCCAWNPKKKPVEKIGTCQNDEHYDITGEKKRGQKVRLWMLYSDEYNDFVGSDHTKMTDEELDKMYDEIESKQFLPNSEKYYCEDCREANTE